MTKIPPDDILEGLYKLRIRESDKLKTVLELYDLEIQKKLGPDYHRLKTMVKSSIEQNLRNKNFWCQKWKFREERRGQESGNKTACTKNSWRLLAMETNGQCVKGDNCSFRHDVDKRGKVTPSNPSPNSFMQQYERKSSRTRSPRGKSPSGRMSRWPCKDYLKGTCNNSFCEKWHPPECLFYKTKSGCRFGEKCSFAHRQVDEQPTERSKKNGDNGSVMHGPRPPSLLLRSDVQEPSFRSSRNFYVHSFFPRGLSSTMGMSGLALTLFQVDHATRRAAKPQQG